MFALLSKVMGNTVVEETRENIRIVNLPVNDLTAVIYSRWGTSRVAKHMFISQSGRRIEFPKFFGVEIIYMLEEIAGAKGVSLALKKACKHIIELLKEETWLHAIDAPQIKSQLDYGLLKVFYKRPLPHQEDFFKEYEQAVYRYKLNGYMLGSPAGSGKTLMGLMLAEMQGAEKIVIVCPKNAIERVWVKTLNEEYRRGPDEYWTSLMNTPPKKDARFYIVHYEAQQRLLPVESSLVGNKTFVILDESHNLNEIKAARTQTFIDFCRNIRPLSVLWASGTPIKAMGSEMIPFLSTIDRLFNEKVAERFKKIFGLSQSRAVEILSHRLGISSYRVDKSVVVDGEPIESDVKVTFPGMERYTLDHIGKEMKEFIIERMNYYDSHREEHESFYDHCISEFRKYLAREGSSERDLKEYLRGVKTLAATKDLRPHLDLMMWVNKYELKVIIPNLPSDLKSRFKDIRSVIKYVHLKIRGEALGRVLGKRRSECATEMVRHMNLGSIVDAAKKKTLIFSSFVSAVDEAKELLTQDGYEPLVVHGGTSKNLPDIVNRYEKDKRINPLIATYQSLSTAVPLIMANVCVLMDQPYRSHDRIQAISRVHRIGQDSQVYVINMLLDTGDEPNVSTRSLDIMQWSQDQVDLMMGIKTIEIQDETLESYGMEELDDISIEQLDRFRCASYVDDVLDSW